MQKPNLEAQGGNLLQRTGLSPNLGEESQKSEVQQLNFEANDERRDVGERL